MADDPLLQEYYTLCKLVSDFDQRFLVVKGWSVTLGLASIALAFQIGHYGIFLVPLFSGLAFLVIDAKMKRHQIQHYVRMREIEVARYNTDQGYASSPQINWTWNNAGKYFTGKAYEAPRKPQIYNEYHEAWNRPIKEMHVLLPHGASIGLGGGFFLLGLCGVLGLKI